MYFKLCSITDADAGEPATQRDQSPLTVPIMSLLQVTLLPAPDLGLAKELLEECTLSVLLAGFDRVALPVLPPLLAKNSIGPIRPRNSGVHWSIRIAKMIPIMYPFDWTSHVSYPKTSLHSDSSENSPCRKTIMMKQKIMYEVL